MAEPAKHFAVCIQNEEPLDLREITALLAEPALLE
jgi:hypothetical protein